MYICLYIKLYMHLYLKMSGNINEKTRHLKFRYISIFYESSTKVCTSASFVHTHTHTHTYIYIYI